MVGQIYKTELNSRCEFQKSEPVFFQYFENRRKEQKKTLKALVDEKKVLYLQAQKCKQK